MAEEADHAVELLRNTVSGPAKVDAKVLIAVCQGEYSPDQALVVSLA